MPPIDSVDLAYGIPLIIVIPSIIQITKQNGLPSRLAGPASIIAATLLLALGDVALASSDGPLGQRFATWLIGGIVYGLAASGFYSLTPPRPDAILRSEDRRPSRQNRSTS